ncbi:MAG TPA: TrbI/VirB10 family protein [Candidatus Acidoferrales bacterium]|nr:TrbI/VirB10 family protein [Candidatus Acidoferrales bacterium]
MAPAADAEIVKGIPTGNAAVVHKPTAQPADLEPPEDAPSAMANPCASEGRSDRPFRFNPETGQPCSAPLERVVVRRAPVQPAAVVAPPPAHEPSTEEKASLAASEQEHAAMVAPTAIRSSEQTGYSSDRQFAPPGGNDLENIAQLTRSLPGGGNRESGAATAGRGLLPPADNDDYNSQNEQGRKQAFLETAATHQTDDYLRSTREAPLSSYEIKAGWEIPAVLEQGLNSDLPGELKALVTVNVYDTATGQFLLIPQGSRLIGKYDSRVSYGQSGVQVVWNRIIFPDASAVDLNGMEGLDAQGNAGLRDKVDRHYKRPFGSAALSSLFSAAFDVSQRQNQSVLNYPNPTQTAEASVSRNMSDTGSAITRRNLNVQPTIKVPVGYRFTVRVNRDILFDASYEPLHADPQPAPEEKQLWRRSSLPSK